MRPICVVGWPIAEDWDRPEMSAYDGAAAEVKSFWYLSRTRCPANADEKPAAGENLSNTETKWGRVFFIPCVSLPSNTGTAQAAIRNCPTWTGVSRDLSEWQLPFITSGFGRFPSSWRERDLSGVMSQNAVSRPLQAKAD